MFEAIQFGPVTVWMRMLFLLIAIWMSTEFFFRLSRAAGLSLQTIKQDARWHFAAFLFGGRLFAVIGDYQSYVRHLFRIFIVWDGNFSFVGGAIGIGVVLFVTSIRHRATLLQWLDVLLPAVTFGLAFDWIGMFLSATAYGKPTNMIWGVTYDTIGVHYTVPIHPVQLYYAIFYFVLTFILLLVRKYSRRAGAETLLGIAALSLMIVCFEFFRGDFGIPVYAKMTDFLFTAALIVSLGILASIEHRLHQRSQYAYAIIVSIATMIYVTVRSRIDLPLYQLRFSQLLAILALLSSVVYVVVHRRKYPHL